LTKYESIDILGQEVIAMLFDSSEQLIDHVVAQTDTALLSFSCGKDSLAMWHAALRAGIKVVPFYLYLVPGLDFVEDSLRYYEDHFKTHIMRFPSPSLYRMLRALVFQPPDRWRAIQEANLSAPKYPQIEDAARTAAGLPATAPVLIGARVADSLARRVNIKRFGPTNAKRRSVQAIYDWRVADVEQALVEADVRLPVDYLMFPRSFDGLRYDYLRPIKDHFPQDFQTILDWFPLADADIFRRERTP